MMVVVYHSTQVWSQHVGSPATPWQSGAAGVDIFFVISGFVMAISTIGREHKEHPARNFLERRLVRLVPLYWLMTALILFKGWFIRGHAQFANNPIPVDTSWPYVLCSFLFIPYRSNSGSTQPVLYLGWSLAFEMFFYLLFAIALALRVRVAGLLTPVMLALAIVGIFQTPAWPGITTLASPYLLEFLAGLLLGYAVRNSVPIPSKISGALGAAGMAVLFSMHRSNQPLLAFAEWAVPACLMVQGVVWTDRKTGRWWPGWMLFVGDASYSIYLSHPLIFTFVVKLLTWMHLLMGGVVRGRDEVVVAAVSLVCAVAGGSMLYVLVERPMTHWLRRTVLHERRPVAA